MRRWLRWGLSLGLVAGMVWIGATVKIRGHTAFGHLALWTKHSHPVRAAMSWIEQRYDSIFARSKEQAKPKTQARDTVRVKSARPAFAADTSETAELEAAATAKNAAILESASREAARPANTPPTPPKKTRIDERLSKHDKKALDDLVSSRVAPR